MKIDKFIILTLTLYVTEVYATPDFAREHGVDCKTCHTMVPTLNETGKNFLRAGFRFSSGDKTTLNRIINPENGESRAIPLSIMLGGGYDSGSEDFRGKLKLYLGGTITENISLFGMTKDNIGGGSGENSKELFELESSRVYGQFNLGEDRDVVRVGLISPLTQFGNIVKSSSDSGLNGNDSTNRQQSMRDGRYQKYGGGHTISRGGIGGDHYQTAVQQSSIGNIRGVEYSHLFDSRMLALISYGEKIDRGRGVDGDDNYQFTTGLQYRVDGGYSLGVIYNRYDSLGQDNFSILLPIEKSFEKAQLVSTLVYRDETEREDSYYGVENSIIYSVGDDKYLRGIIDYGVQDSEDSYGLSLTYSIAYRYMILHLTGARKDGGGSDENLLLGSLSFIF